MHVQEQRKKEQEEREAKEAGHRLYIAEQQKMADQLIGYELTTAKQTDNTNARSKSRLKAAEEIKAENVQNIHKTYVLDPATVHLLKSANISSEKFSTAVGNQLQQVIQQELITIVSIIAQKEMQQTIQQYNIETIEQTILSFADVSCSYTKKEEIVKAVTLADWCWSSLELIQQISLGTTNAIIAAGNGIAHGIANTSAMILKPHKALYNIGVAVAQVANLLPTLSKNFATLATYKQ